MRYTNYKVVSILLIMLGMLGVSGCVGGTNYSSTAGVQINKMSFDFPKMTDDFDETVSLAFELENVGSKQMPGEGRYWVYGPAIDETDDDKNIWRTSSGLMGNLYQDEFYPPVEGIPGAVVYESIDLHPPDVPEGMVDSYNFFARVCYPYETTSLFKVYSQSQEERSASRKMVGSKQVNTDSEKRASAGPIQIELNTQKQVILRTSSSTLNLYFTISDVGGGFSTVKESDGNCPSGKNDANVPSTDRGKVEVSVMVDGQDCVINTESVRIRSGTGNFNCKISDLDDAAKDPNHEFTIVATAKYNYWIDDQATITVEDSVY